MRSKTVLLEQMEREREYLNEQEVGTEEYNASMHRLITYEKEVADLEKFEAETAMKEEQFTNEKRHKVADWVWKGVTFAVGSVAIPIGALVYITATEKEHTFRGELRSLTHLCFPKKQ